MSRNTSLIPQVNHSKKSTLEYKLDHDENSDTNARTQTQVQRVRSRCAFHSRWKLRLQYYRLTSFYQNYNSYFSSRDSLQLMGENSDASTCAAVNSDYNRIGVTEENCDPATDAGCEYMFPCGLISNSMFNDTFTLETQSDSSSCTCATQTKIRFPRDSTAPSVRRGQNQRVSSHGQYLLAFR